jgi:hypothetical protein
MINSKTYGVLMDGGNYKFGGYMKMPKSFALIFF